MNKCIKHTKIKFANTKDSQKSRWSWLKVWYIIDPHVKHHRENGPALIWSDGNINWFLNGKEYTEKEYWQELYKRKIITKEKLFLKIL